MRNILGLLERFSRSLNKDIVTKENIIQVISERTQINLKPENINLKNGVLEIATSSSATKNEINLKESIIKSELKRSHNIFISRFTYK